MFAVLYFMNSQLSLCFVFLSSLSKKETIILTTKLKSSAYQILATVKPCTKCASIKTIMAFIKIRKIPNVMIVIGSVSIMSSGFAKISSKAHTAATISAVTLLFTATPGSSQLAIMIASQVKNIFIRNFMFSFKR